MLTSLRKKNFIILIIILDSITNYDFLCPESTAVHPGTTEVHPGGDTKRHDRGESATGHVCVDCTRQCYY